MKPQIYVNLPVNDLKRSSAFFESLGFQLEPKFSNDQASCVILGDNIFAMLLVESFFKTFTDKSICDAKKQTEVLVCLSCESRAKVDELVKKLSQAADVLLENRRIKNSCMAMALRISMAISGN
ncbi:MAG TPA: hypothetical protein VJ372_10845 [Pyrinomonadaceae bacterium]|jgi:Predicted lactoylglutathione lyase|nr:hypothetical protein [Pyrinomonadaceae bacterium]